MRGSRPLLLFVIGIGNPLRGDDGGGITFARALGEAFSRRGVLFYLQVTQQLLPELAEAIATAEASSVIFVDAAAHTAGVELQPVRAGQQPGGLSHHASAETIMMLVNRLYEWPAPGWLVTVPAAGFEHGHDPRNLPATYKQADHWAGVLLQLTNQRDIHLPH
jgi:hydrogenase maturation protease